MPEAAEVTVAARQLDLVATGRELRELAVSHPRTTRSQAVESLAVFAGARITSVARHGKWIVVSFADRDARLGIHLRMSGQLLARHPDDVPPDRHVHARLHLGPPNPVLVGRRATGSDHRPTRTGWGVPAPPSGAPGTDDEPVVVWFRDPRTFGELRILSGPPPVTADLFDPDVTATWLAARAANRRVGVKAVLLDQVRAVSGIGSYLADEALHRAGIDPRRPAADLHRTAWARILDAARDITTSSAAAGGVTLPDEGWVDLWGRPGRYADALRVHGRLDCGTCGAPTRSAVVGGRSARWCPRCQDHRRVR